MGREQPRLLGPFPAPQGSLSGGSVAAIDGGLGRGFYLPRGAAPLSLQNFPGSDRWAPAGPLRNIIRASRSDGPRIPTEKPPADSHGPVLRDSRRGLSALAALRYKSGQRGRALGGSSQRQLPTALADSAMPGSGRECRIARHRAS